jgi:Ca2+-binding EF-hand superfamily protein
MPPKAAKARAATKEKATRKAEEKKKAEGEFDVAECLKKLGEVERKYLESDAFQQQLDTVFMQADANQNGELEGDEISTAVFKLASPDRRGKLNIFPDNVVELVMRFDANKDGTINKEELAAFVRWVLAKEVHDYFNNTASKRKEEGQKVLDEVLDKLFKCYDTDEDGLIERVELLEAEEQIEKILDGRSAFLSMRDKKDLIAWFKESGATGNVNDGMFLKPEDFKRCYPSKAKKRLARSEFLDERLVQLDPAEHPDRFAHMLKARVVDPFHEIRFPPKAPKGEEVLGPDGTPSLPPLPEYPVIVDFHDLKKHIDTAAAHKKPFLCLAHGVAAVESYIGYQSTVAFDCKLAIAELHIKKEKTKEQIKADLRSKLQLAAKGPDPKMVVPRPLWIRMANSAFTLSDFFDDQAGLPAKLFQPGYSHLDAIAHGLVPEMMKVEAENNWKHFAVWVTSTFDLESGMEYLKDAIPSMKEMAVVEIDPKTAD